MSPYPFLLCEGRICFCKAAGGNHHVIWAAPRLVAWYWHCTGRRMVSCFCLVPHWDVSFVGGHLCSFYVESVKHSLPVARLHLTSDRPPNTLVFRSCCVWYVSAACVHQLSETQTPPAVFCFSPSEVLFWRVLVLLPPSIDSRDRELCRRVGRRSNRVYYSSQHT